MSNPFEQIESLSSDFRKRLRNGESARIEDYLARIDESARTHLFQNLLLLELRFRGTRGEAPSSSEYIQRFPQFKAQIRQAFLEPSLSSIDGLSPSPEYEPTVVPEVAIGRQLGDYELLRELGRGTFGIVYEARHVMRKDRVALKDVAV